MRTGPAALLLAGLAVSLAGCGGDAELDAGVCEQLDLTLYGRVAEALTAEQGPVAEVDAAVTVTALRAERALAALPTGEDDLAALLRRLADSPLRTPEQARADPLLPELSEVSEQRCS